MTGVCLVVVTDGRGEYLRQAMAAAEVNLKGAASTLAGVIVDDSGDPTYSDWLEHEFPSFHQFHHERRRGLGAAVATAWARARESGLPYVFHLEDDFVLTEPLDLVTMTEVLDADPQLAQLVLKRQPWSIEEHAAGGQIEVAPGEFDDDEIAGWPIVRHRRLFSFNPSLIPVAALDLVPHGGLEADVTDVLLAAGCSFAYWGRRGDPPRCRHIGHERSPGWRL